MNSAEYLVVWKILQFQKNPATLPKKDSNFVKLLKTANFKENWKDF